jgi:asparagine synthase (glutamine-hydrolysing)
MCGIAGILTQEVRGDEARHVACMQQALRHRGPDDAGTWQSSDQRATFAHTRLSVLDLSVAGRQPMSTADGRFTITFNGEIYNFAELRRGLEAKGCEFRTRTDTEVILRAYEAFGEACVHQLRGMFAFAIWDQRERTALLARDRFGIKPLYYCAHDDRLVFASEMRALLQTGAVPRQVDGQAIYEYLRAGSVQEPRTLLRGVRSLEAGHTATWDGQLRARKYWHLSFAISREQASPAMATHQALADSVRHHFVSDRPVGMFLSGGIDSSCLLTLAAQAGVSDLRTFTLSVEGSADDEGGRARRTAEHFGASHAEYRVDASESRQLFTQYLAVIDQPSIDGLNTLAISRFAADRGMKVMLSGIGADELFGGYPSFSAVPRMTVWRQRLGAVRRPHAAVAQLLEKAGDPRYRRLADVIAQPPSLAASYAAYRGIFSREEARLLAERYGAPAAADFDDMPMVEGSDPTPADSVSRLELSRYMRNQLLRDADVMSMACGLELRTPFLDTAVVEAVCRIPASWRLRRGKQMLIESVNGIPDGIVHRPKRGFQFPFERWLDGEWRQTFAGREQIGSISTTTWYRKWCVLVLEHWLTTVAHTGRSWT